MTADLPTAGAGPRILRIDASARRAGSASRELTDYLIARLRDRHPGAEVVVRDLAAGLPRLDEELIAARAAPEDERSAEQAALVQKLRTLADELIGSEVRVIGLPMYNYTLPAALKAYIDLIVRPGLAFESTPDGPRGLVPDGRTYVVVATGGTELFGPRDFLTGYLSYILNLIGIRDVEYIAADRLARGRDDRLADARARIDALIQD